MMVNRGQITQMLRVLMPRSDRMVYQIIFAALSQSTNPIFQRWHAKL